jgi:integrase
VRTVPDPRRATAGISNAEINRELTTLKRAFTLAMQACKLMVRPYIELLEEANARHGFFEREQLEALRAHLPEPLRPVVAFGYLTGWRVPSEVLTLRWSQVDSAQAPSGSSPTWRRTARRASFP